MVFTCCLHTVLIFTLLLLLHIIYSVLFLLYFVKSSLMNCLILLTGLLPDDPNVIVGQNLSMTCQLYSDQYHARDLRFEFRLYPARRKNPSRVSRRKNVHRQASPSDVHFVNASAVELYYTNVRSRYDRATVVCYHRKHKQDLHDSQIIKVGCECFFCNFSCFHNI